MRAAVRVVVRAAADAHVGIASVDALDGVEAISVQEDVVVAALVALARLAHELLALQGEVERVGRIAFSVRSAVHAYPCGLHMRRHAVAAPTHLN